MPPGAIRRLPPASARCRISDDPGRRLPSRESDDARRGSQTHADSTTDASTTAETTTRRGLPVVARSLSMGLSRDLPSVESPQLHIAWRRLIARGFRRRLWTHERVEDECEMDGRRVLRFGRRLGGRLRRVRCPLVRCRRRAVACPASRRPPRSLTHRRPISTGDNVRPRALAGTATPFGTGRTGHRSPLPRPARRWAPL